MPSPDRNSSSQNPSRRRQMSHSADSQENYRLPDLVSTLEDPIITLKMRGNNEIFFEHIDGAFHDGAAERGRGNNPANYKGRPIAFIRVFEAKAMKLGPFVQNLASTSHIMLSDGNIIREKQPHQLRWIFSETENRVYPAILGAILTHCNEAHVLDPHQLVPEGNIKSLSWVFNRHELLKMFDAIQCIKVRHVVPVEGLRFHELQHYSDDEILELLYCAHSRGKTFSIASVSEAQKRFYTYAKTFGGGEERFGSLPPELSSIFHTEAAGETDTKDHQPGLFWY